VLTAGESTGLAQSVELVGAERIFLIVTLTILGLLVGSFLNVVIVRVPAGRSVVSPRSACMTCEKPISGWDNVPVLSWLLLRGRSRCCDEPIGIRYPLVEAGTAVAFGAVAAWAGLSWLLPALLYLAAISIALAMIDLEHHRLPDAITFPSYPIAAALLILAALADGQPGRLLRAAICGLALYAFFFVLMVINPKGMGFGDVKLAGILGLYFGWFGWQYAIIGGFAGFFLGGAVGIVLMILRRAGRKTQIPFGPYMIVGAWLALAWAAPVTTWYLDRAGIS
jgi:leader peptidase (prepilin peptidase)/N-methyltransferase